MGDAGAFLIVALMETFSWPSRHSWGNNIREQSVQGRIGPIRDEDGIIFQRDEFQGAQTRKK